MTYCVAMSLDAGLLFASMAMAVQLLVIAARRETRRASHLVMRHTGFTRRAPG